MKVTLFSVLAFVTAALAVQAPLKSVIISYPDNTPDSVIDQAMDAVKAAGGMVRVLHVLRVLCVLSIPLPLRVGSWSILGAPLSPASVNGILVLKFLEETMLTPRNQIDHTRI
jgi:hypothetical protein